jgi:hypothetical protein
MMNGKKYLGLLATAIISMVLSQSANALEIIKYNGDVAYLSLSADSANRIIFPSNIVTKVYSKEKGVNIVEKGNELFVKWTPFVTTMSEVDQNGQVSQIEAPKVDYSKAKIVDLFVTTESGTYSLILKPAAIAQETVVISNPAEDQKKTMAFEIKDPYVDTMKKLVDIGFDLASETPNLDMQNFKVEKLHGQENIDVGNKVNAVLKGKLTGSLFSIYIYEIKNKTNKTLELLESEFNRLPVPKKLAISLYSNELFPYQKSAIIVVARNNTSETGK